MKNICLLLIAFISTLHTSAQNITFRSLTPDNGLSHVSVNDLYQDERGFIWIATREGVNCYNGSNIQTYKHQKDTQNTLTSNNILKLHGNSDGKVYLLSIDGVSEWDIKKERFSTIYAASDISAIYYNQGFLYIGQNNQIYTYDKDAQLKPFYNLPAKDETISILFVDKNNKIWIGTHNNGLYRLDIASNQLTHLVPDANVISIYMDNEEEVWVGTWEHGLYRITGDEVQRYNHNSHNNSISSNFVRHCSQDNKGDIWIGTFLGLDKFDKKTNEFTHYTPDGFNGMTHNSVWGMIKDHQGTIWFGTYFGGVNYFNPDYEIYTQYRESDIEKNGLSSSIVGKMTEDNKNNLWICTEGGGVNVYNRTTKTFKWYKHDEKKNSISHNNVKSIYYDNNKDIVWIGTHLGGLNKLDLKTNRFTHYKSIPNDPTSLPSNIILDIVPYKENLFVGTDNGICLFYPATGECKQMFKNHKEGKAIKTVTDLFIDYYGKLWIATQGEGVFSYDIDKDELTNYKHDSSNPHSISSNNINNIAQDHYYNLWISTSGSGLDLFDYNTKEFKNFDSANNGIISDCIYEVRESRFGKLLVITNQGFSQFDYANMVFHNYTIQNGFPLSSINENAHFLTNDGEVFLGGVKGMVSFYEKELNFPKAPYKIIPNVLTANNSPVKVGDDSGILKEALYIHPDITLPSKYAVFSINFSTTNFIPANRDNIIYKLEGFSQDWASTNGINNISYTNLNPGKYTLIIKAEDNTPAATIDINILPPFYKTIYAYIAYYIIAAIIIFFMLRTYNGRIKLQESLKYEQKHLQDVEELNQSKLQFFTNISHEFRTPLTLIIAQMEMLIQLEPFAPKVYNKLLSVYKACLQMRGLISELLDFQKQEKGLMTIKVAEHNIVDFLNENYLLFKETATNKQINFIFEKEVDKIFVWYDEVQMQKVINNLVSNALKHTEEGDTITISIKQENDKAIIKVTDTGDGIDAQHLDKIFNQFYQTDNLSTSTGIGLSLTKGIVELHHGTISVDSTKNNGATFTVTLQLGKAHFTNDQIATDEEYSSIEKREIILLNEESADLSITPPKYGAKMLIVEDNKALREMLVRILSPFYTLRIAEDGEEAIRIIKEDMPDIILSDVLMPKISGIELCKFVKTNTETAHIPIVLLTARTTTEHTLEGLQNGADDYITKPFNINVLITRCNNLVNSRLFLQEKFSQQPQMTPLMLATNKLDKEFIDKVMSIIDKNMTNPEFNVDELADELNIARTTIYAKIKAVTGQTPNKFIQTIKLKKAAFMLKNNPELRITEIADITGFTSSGYFGKCFKEIYHMTPNEYREQGENTQNT